MGGEQAVRARTFVFAHQSVATQKEKHRHAVVAEVRKHIQQHLRMQHLHMVQQFQAVFQSKDVFIFVHRHGKPVTEVVYGDAQDGNSFQCAGVLFVEHVFLVSLVLLS